MPELTPAEKLTAARTRLQKALDAKRAEVEAAGREIVPWDPDAEDERGVWAPNGSTVLVRAADIVTLWESTEYDAMFREIAAGSRDALAPRGPKGPQASPRMKVTIPFSNVEWLLSQAGG